jgi:8-oxo-dGTP pyrophosphatase MutT (NUDIX family)
MVHIDESWYRRPEGVKRRTSAGGVVLRHDGHEWLIAVARERNPRLLVLPKGGVEPGESLEHAARREVEEETGLWDLHLIGPIGQRSRLTFNRKRWVTIHYFLYTTRQEIGIPGDASRHPFAVEWFTLEDLPDLYWPEQRDLLLSQHDRIMQMVGSFSHV